MKYQEKQKQSKNIYKGHLAQQIYAFWNTLKKLCACVPFMKVKFKRNLQLKRVFPIFFFLSVALEHFQESLFRILFSVGENSCSVVLRSTLSAKSAVARFVFVWCIFFSAALSIFRFLSCCFLLLRLSSFQILFLASNLLVFSRFLPLVLILLYLLSFSLPKFCFIFTKTW